MWSLLEIILLVNKKKVSLHQHSPEGLIPLSYACECDWHVKELI